MDSSQQVLVAEIMCLVFSRAKKAKTWSALDPLRLRWRWWKISPGTNWSWWLEMPWFGRAPFHIWSPVPGSSGWWLVVGSLVGWLGRLGAESQWKFFGESEMHVSCFFWKGQKMMKWISASFQVCEFSGANQWLGFFFRLLKNTEKPFLYYLGLFDGDLMWCTIVTKVLTQCWRFGCHLRRLQQGLLADLWSIASWAGGWRKWRITGNQQGGSRWLLCLLIKHVSKFCPKMDRNHENEWFHEEKEHFLQRTLYSCWLLLLFLQALYTFDFLATEACISQTCA